MTQYGFFFDQSRCIGCQACAAACKSWNVLPAGPTKWLRLFQWEKGAFPNTRVNTLFAPCYHCANPVCVDAAQGAMYKEGKYGAVLIDPDKATSANLRAAWQACPYGAIVFESDSPDAAASKCTLCVDRLQQSLLPACVTACPMRALDFGPMDQLQAKYGKLSQLEDMPDGSTVAPAVVFKAKDVKKTLVPYPSDKALSLMAQRDPPLPKVFSSPSDVTDLGTGLIGRGTLVLKAKSTAELQLNTVDANS